MTPRTTHILLLLTALAAGAAAQEVPSPYLEMVAHARLASALHLRSEVRAEDFQAALADPLVVRCDGAFATRFSVAVIEGLEEALHGGKACPLGCPGFREWPWAGDRDLRPLGVEIVRIARWHGASIESVCEAIGEAFCASLDSYSSYLTEEGYRLAYGTAGTTSGLGLWFAANRAALVVRVDPSAPMASLVVPGDLVVEIGERRLEEMDARDQRRAWSEVCEATGTGDLGLRHRDGTWSRVHLRSCPATTSRSRRGRSRSRIVGLATCAGRLSEMGWPRELGPRSLRCRSRGSADSSSICGGIGEGSWTSSARSQGSSWAASGS